MTRETWKPVLGWDGLYEVSDIGSVRSIRRRTASGTHGGGVMKQKINAGGYCRVLLSRGANRVNASVHRLVLEAFVGPRPDGLQACHNDGDKLNNRASNLRWDTHANNVADKFKHGAVLAGERHPRAKLTVDSIMTLLAMSEAGESQRAIGRALGVKHQTVGKILRGELWQSVTAAL